MNLQLNGLKMENTQGVTTPSGTALKSKLMRYSVDRPNEVKLINKNKDGSAFFHIPINYIKISPPKRVSDEQKEAARIRFQKMREEKKRMQDNN